MALTGQVLYRSTPLSPVDVFYPFSLIFYMFHVQIILYAVYHFYPYFEFSPAFSAVDIRSEVKVGVEVDLVR